MKISAQSSFKFGLLLLVIASCLISFSCYTGGRGSLFFKGLKYTASMSPVLFDYDGQLLLKDRDLQTLKKYRYEKNLWGIFYSLASLSSDRDIVRDMNQAVRKAGGEGLINLSFVQRNCEINGLLNIVGFLPFIPGCVTVSITGEIVKRKSGGTAK